MTTNMICLQVQQKLFLHDLIRQRLGEGVAAPKYTCQAFLCV